MVKNLLAAIFGEVIFSAQGGRYERFLSDCVQAGMPVHQVAPCPGGVTAAVSARYYRRLHPLARRCRVRLKVQKKQGLCFAARRFRGRWGLPLGLVMFYGAMVLMQQLVWEVQYVQLPAAQQAVMNRQLHQMDLCAGAWVSPEKLDRAQQQLELAHPELAWLSLNFVKGRLVVESSPASPVPPVESNAAQPLVAAADGTIQKVNIQEGYCEKRPGQTVAKGEILVAAEKPDRDQVMIPSHAKGSVVALVEKTYECTQPLRYTAELPTGQVLTRKTLCLLGKRIALGRPLQGRGEQRVRQYPLTMLSFALPITVEEEQLCCTAPQLIQLNQKAAREFADYACHQALYEEFPDAQIVAETPQEEWTEKGLRFTLKVQFLADIARNLDTEKE